MKYFYILLLSFSLSSISVASTFDTIKIADTKTFLKTFDYQNYLKTVQIDDLKTLEADRKALMKLQINGDDFIWALFENYIKNTELNFNESDGNIKELLRLGEVMFHSTNYLPDSIYIYTAVSDLIFETIAQPLESSIETEKFNKNDFHIRYLCSRLCDNKYCINIKIPTSEKILYNIQQGNWTYLWFKGTTTYLKEFLLIIAGIIILIASLVWGIVRLRRSRKNKKNVQNNLPT